MDSPLTLRMKLTRQPKTPKVIKMKALKRKLMQNPKEKLRKKWYALNFPHTYMDSRLSAT